MPYVGKALSRSNTAESQVLADEKTRLKNTTVARIADASKNGLEDPAVVKECCARLQKINNTLKGRIADMDAMMARDSMQAGVLKGGIRGCDDSKLISVLCTRTKASLERTKAAYVSPRGRDESRRRRGRATWIRSVETTPRPRRRYFDAERGPR